MQDLYHLSTSVLPLDQSEAASPAHVAPPAAYSCDLGGIDAAACDRLAQDEDLDQFAILAASLGALLSRYKEAQSRDGEPPITFRERLRSLQQSGQQAPSTQVRSTQAQLFRLAFARGDRNPAEFPSGIVICVETSQYSANLKSNWHSHYSAVSTAVLARIAGHWSRLLPALVARPDELETVHDLLTPAEWHQTCVDWNATRRPYDRDASIASVFRSAAQKFGGRCALDDNGLHLSYTELDRASDIFARQLIAAGLRPGDPVGFAVPRSAHLIIAMVGALKAGGAYVPLDLTYPVERLRFMLEDTAVRIVAVAEQGPAGALSQATGDPETCPTLIPCEARTLLADRSTASAEFPAMNGDSSAYIMYTSGSTGRPKGVEIPQRAILRLVCQNDYVNFGPELVFAQISNASFDAMTFEVWGALLHGARLVFLPADVVLSPSRFGAALAHHGITAMFLTSALFNIMARENAAGLSGVTNLMVGGDAVDPSSARYALKAGAVPRLINGYGPTEVTTFAVTHAFSDVPAQATTVPIGRPIANTTAYVLDQAKRPAPVGISGELYLGGDGLAKGYWNAPALTAERFVWCTFPGRPPERLYRTGDLARYRKDGIIEHLGRLDDQVKVRGFRIELGEIVSALRTHPHVEDSLALVDDDAVTGKRIVAYAASSEKLDPAELKHYLEGKLPAFAVPSFIVVLGRFPLTANGKVDRAALPRPLAVGTPAPKVARHWSPAEEKMATLWQQVLGCPVSNLDTNFFDLGGNSILLATLGGLLEREWGATAPLSMVDLFQYTTVRQQAARLETGQTSLTAASRDAQARAAGRAQALAARNRPTTGRTTDTNGAASKLRIPVHTQHSNKT